MGRNGFHRAWRELIDRGYIRQYQFRNKGKFHFEYEIMDVPCTPDPDTKEPLPCTEMPDTADSATNNTIDNNTDRKKLSKNFD